MTSRRAAALTLLLALVAGLLAACGGGDDEVEAPPRETTGPSAPATTSPRATVPPDAPGVQLNAYFARGEKLGTAHRRVPQTRAVARAAVEQLLAGPTDAERQAGLHSEVPAGTELLDLDVADGLATVDLSSAYDDGGGSLTMFMRLTQLVFTLTQFPTVEGVNLRIDGRPVTVFSNEGIVIDEPMTRTSFTDVLPFILVESVAPGDVVTSPVTIAGLNNTFESNVRLRVLGADRRILADTFTTGRGGMGIWGPFSADVRFDRGSDTNGFVVVFDNSAETGAVTNLVEIPVRFA